MRDATTILISPVITEKTSNLTALGKYVFEVDVKVNKIEVKKAVEEIYGVKVKKVNIINTARKPKRLRFHQGYTKTRKKAVVTLVSGEIDFFKTK